MSTRGTFAALASGLALSLGMLAVVLVRADGASAQAPTAAGTSCDALARLTIPEIRVVSTSSVAAGPFTPPGARSAITVATFCRVVAVAAPSSDSTINFEVWLPQAAAWNGRLEAVGNNGFTGVVEHGALAAALARGTAAVSSDTGHGGGDLAFAQGHPEKVIDWAYRAVHVTTDAAKIMVRNHLGRFPTHAYFNGCNTGGHQAISEAQRYPEDFDGIIAGSPANDRINEIAAYLHVWKATHRDGVNILPADKLHLLGAAATAACDSLDGVKDGVLENPLTCQFDPATLQCRGADGADCLTHEQVAAVRSIYDGPRNPRTGEHIFSGWPRGSESAGPSATGGPGWRQLIDLPEPRRVDFWRTFVFDNPHWDWRTFDFDRDLAYANAKIGFVSATDHDLSAFQAAGGKMLIYAGWADPILPGGDVVHYYENLVRSMGGAERTASFARLFMMPGVGHCSGGPGPDRIDAVSAIEQWVEQGAAPSMLIASKVTGGKVVRTRPLCAFPQIARWSGSGSTDDHANFTCSLP